ncbi:MAG: Wzz/FepE/Etk N-terminal domain-containing protein, partial [Pseudomonadota bacterium]
MRRGKWRIFFWMALLLVLSGYYAYKMVTPLYTTTATVALQNRAESIVDLASPLSALGGDFFTINTEAEVITSRELIAQLVDNTNLIEDPTFNYTLRPEDNSWSVGKAIGSLISGVIGLVFPQTESEPELPPTESEIR